MSAEKHPIRNSVIGTLIATAAIALVAYFVPGGWASVFTHIGLCYRTGVSWLGSPLSVPAWIVVVLSLLSILVVVGIVFLAFIAIRGSEDKIASYTEGDFFGIKWRWRYYQGGIHQIVAFCPICDLQAVSTVPLGYRALRCVAYRCDDGHWQSEIFDFSQEELVARVERKIHQEIRKRSENKNASKA